MHRAAMLEGLPVCCSAGRTSYWGVSTVVHSEQMGRSSSALNNGCTVTLPKSGSVQFIVKACGGTRAGIALENGLETPAELWRRMLNVAGVSMPRLKFILKVVPLKLALNPRPQAGARPI